MIAPTSYSLLCASPTACAVRERDKALKYVKYTIDYFQIGKFPGQATETEREKLIDYPKPKTQPRIWLFRQNPNGKLIKWRTDDDNLHHPVTPLKIRTAASDPMTLFIRPLI